MRKFIPMNKTRFCFCILSVSEFSISLICCSLARQLSCLKRKAPLEAFAQRLCGHTNHAPIGDLCVTAPVEYIGLLRFVKENV